MKAIKLCEGHKNGLGFLKAFGQVPKDVKATIVPKAQCEQCKANNLIRGKGE